MREHAEPAVPATPAAKAQLRFAVNSATVKLATLAGSATGIVVVPIYVSALGADYGVWVTLLSLAALAGTLDLGFFWITVKQVAAGAGGRDRVLGGAGWAYVASGAAGVALLGAAAWATWHAANFGDGIRAGVVLSAVAAAFFAEHLTGFRLAILSGRRRYELSALLSLAMVVVRAGGMVALLWRGYRLEAVALWHAATSVAGLAISHAAALRLMPDLPLLHRAPDFAGLRGELKFGGATLAATVASGAMWQAPALVLAMVAGPLAVVVYDVGQKFAVLLSTANWRATEGLFAESVADAARAPEMLRFATRWLLLLSAPVAAVLMVFAPPLLAAWLGEAMPGAATVMRLTLLGVVCEAASLPAVHALWARGRFGAVAWIFAAAAAGMVAGSLLLAPRFGAAGVGAAFCAASLGSAAALLAASVSLTAQRGGRAAADVLMAATVAASVAAVAYGLREVFAPASLPAIMLAAVAALAVYAGAGALLLLRRGNLAGRDGTPHFLMSLMQRLSPRG